MRSTAPRYHVLACASLARAVYAAAAAVPAVVTVDVLPQGLHDRPRHLRSELQQRIDRASGPTDGGPDRVDAVLLAYGLCGAATAGLVAREVPLVLTRAHDCITLHLGGRDRYDAEFAACPGTYWMSRDFLERNTRGDVATLGVSPAGLADLVARHGPDNAAYLADAMQAWAAAYGRVVWIDGGPGGRADGLRDAAEARARAWGLPLEVRPTDHRLVTALLAGEWGADHLVVRPGHRVVVGSPEDVVDARPVEGPPLPSQKGLEP